MKTTAFATLIKDKNLQDESQINDIVEKINEELNSTITKKEHDFMEKQNKINDELTMFKAKLADVEKQKQEETKKLESIQNELNLKISEKSKMEEKLFIVKNTNGTLNDEDIEDIITLAEKRTLDGSSKEEALNRVLEKYSTRDNTQSFKTPSNPKPTFVEPIDDSVQNDAEWKKNFINQSVSWKAKK